MLRINILAVFIVMVQTAPAPYYSLVESPTSRFEQHFFTSPQQTLKVELQRQILPISEKQEFPDQHVVYFYPEMQVHHDPQYMNQHRLLHESPVDSHDQFLEKNEKNEQESDEDKSEEILETSSEILTTSSPENIEIGLENASTIKTIEKAQKQEESEIKIAEIKSKIGEVLPKLSEEPSPKQDAESIEIRSDSNVPNNFLPVENMFSGSPDVLFNRPHITQPVLHRLYTMDNKFFAASTPEFYGFFHPVHNPNAPIFSLQELQPIVNTDQNIETEAAEKHNIAALPMTSFDSRTSREREENREGEADLRSQLSTSTLRINVVDEDETEEIKSNEATETKARSELPSRNQNSMELERKVEASREDDKQEQSVEGDAINYQLKFKPLFFELL